MKRGLFAALAFVLATLAVMRPAAAIVEAGEAYVYPTFQELTQTTLLLGGLSTDKDPQIVDEYIRLMYCDLYRENYKDDFAWHQLREQFTTKINSKKEYYRSLYQIVGRVEMNKYDFANQRFPLVKKSAFVNVGTMVLFTEADFKPYCDIYTRDNMRGAYDHLFPRYATINLSHPFTFTSFKVPMDEAEKILARMQKLHTDGRKLYIRFRFRVQAVKSVTGRNKNYYKTELTGELASVDLFYDKELTQWLARLPLK
jgi:hypothetical protein